MSEQQETYTVIGLYSENVKRVKVVHIQPPAIGVVKVGGMNEQGKSSALDSIMLALAGKSVEPALPIRRGAKHAKVVVDLGALKVERKWTGKDSYLEVTQAGKPIKRPQEFLDALIGSGLGFDPLDFLRMKPADQVRTLLDLVKPAEDPRALDDQRKALYEQRRDLNRDKDKAAGDLGALPEPPADTPDVAINVTEIAQEHRRLVGVHHEHDRLDAERRTRLADTDHWKEEVARMRREVLEAEKRLEIATRRHQDAQDALDLHEVPDLTAVTDRLQRAEEINQAVTLKRARTTAQEALADLTTRSDALTGQIDGIEERKRAVLGAAKFPVPGLGFSEVNGDWMVTFNGVPLQDAAHSAQIKVGLAMATALAPKVRVVLIRDASTLDADNLEWVRQFAEMNGVQVWAEIVGTDDQGAFIIEDGGVIRAPEKPAQAGLEW